MSNKHIAKIAVKPNMIEAKMNNKDNIVEITSFTSLAPLSLFLICPYSLRSASLMKLPSLDIIPFLSLISP